MNLLKLASRNVIRNRHRSIVTMLAMGFACAMMIVFAGLMAGMLKGSEFNIVSVNTGDIQIHQPGYRQDPDIYNLITNANQIQHQLRQAGFNVTSRLYTAGLMASDQASSGVILRGVDLDSEVVVSAMSVHLMQGGWLADEDQQGVVIGRKLARLLDVGIGEQLIFVGQTADGYMANDVFHVRGILKSVSSTIDNAGVIMHVDMLRQLISLPEGAHELVVMRTDTEQPLDIAQQQVQRIVGEQLEVMNWQQLMPIIARFLETAEVQTLIMQLFTYIAVGSVVLNAVLMSVFERIHQFGIMKAIGVSPWQLIRLIYLESLIMAFISAVIGIALGTMLTWYFQESGIDMSALAGSFSFAGIALDPIWYAQLNFWVVSSPVIFLLLMTMISVIYPALKAARLRPIEAIYHQ